MDVSIKLIVNVSFIYCNKPLLINNTMSKRITRTLTLSYVPTSRIPVCPFPPRYGIDEHAGGITLIPNDLTLLSYGMEQTAQELAPLIANQETANFTFEYVSGISEQPLENSGKFDPDKVLIKTRYWRQLQSAKPLQDTVKLCVKQMKRDGVYYDKIADVRANDLDETMFAFKVIEMMTSCAMEPLADELVSYIGVGKGAADVKIDSTYNTSFRGVREYNQGCVILSILNESLMSGDELTDYEREKGAEFVRGRYIADETGRSIIQRAIGLRRSPRVRGPANCGNPIVNGQEVTYDEAGYWYEYGMYGSPDTGKYMQERDDQDSVIEFPVE